MSIPFDADEIIEAIGNDLVEQVNQLGISFVTNVVPRTPVRTGHARRNWQVNLGSPNLQELPGFDFAGANTIANGITRLRASSNRNPFTPVIVENNAPYIGKLNDGFSPQAPAMFVESALLVAINDVVVRKVL